MSWLVLLIATAYFIVRGPVWNWHGSLWDYAVCTSSSYEWLHGRDPFDNARVIAGWSERGSDVDMSAHAGALRAIVPPPTLVLLTPFAAMPQLAGAVAYLLSAGALLAIALWRGARWARLSDNASRAMAAAALASMPLIGGTLSGNPALLAVPLILIGLERSLRGSPRLGGVLLGLGTACKMQIGGPLVVAVWLLRQRRAPLWAMATAVLVSLTGAARSAAVGQNVWRAWASNVAETNVAGGLNDFARPANAIDFLNLQAPIFQLSGSRRAADVVAWTVAGVLSAIALRFIVRCRRVSPELTLIAIGLAATLLLLPIYHRTYDGLVLLPVLALALRTAGHADRWRRIAALGCLALLLVPAGLVTRLVQLGVMPVGVQSSGLVLGTLGAHKAWATLGLAVVLLEWLRRATPVEESHPREEA